MAMLRPLLLLLCLGACAMGVRIIGGHRPVAKEEVDPKLLEKMKAMAVSSFNVQSFGGCRGCHTRTYYAAFGDTSVHRQVVRGLRYTLELKLVPTLCNNTGRADQPQQEWTRCGISTAASPVECRAVFLSVLWEKTLVLEKIRCVPMVTTVLKRSAREAPALGSSASFEQFKARFGRRYASAAEEAKRLAVFRVNMQKAQALNALELGTAVYGASPFADMTEAEFRHTHLTPVWDQSKMPEKMARVPRGPAPAAFDWRQHNAVTPVKNQEQCGSCWAFSTTGNVEGQWAIHKSKLVSLSEQELVDCDKVDQGCGGGLPSNAYKAIMQLGGLETEASYPYEARNDRCHFDRSKVVAYVNGSVALPQDETKLAAWLAQNGPISIGINAFAMQFYMGGISHPWSFLCNPSKLDHGVLLVGYAVQGTEPYWIVKNSWGASWGEKGYYLVYRGGGVCGLNRMATSAVVN